jgi:hypothetical protein
MSFRVSTLIAGLLSVSACTPPPPAPEGLDDAARFVFREFYADDGTVGAGLTGLMNWYQDEGYSLAGQGATIDEDTEVEGVQPASAFTLANLEWDDLSRISLPDDGRALEDARGTVSLQEMPCSWKETEALLARSDQHVVFEGTFDSYERTYVSSRGDYEAARDSLEFTPILSELPDLHAPDYVHDGLEPSVMLTTNHISSTELGVTLDYEYLLDFRHGFYEVQGELLPVWMILSWLKEPASGQGGNNTFEQSYGIEVTYGTGDTALRIFANWSFVDSVIAGPDSSIWTIGAVNKSRDAAQRLSDICSGEIELPPEG